MLVISTFVIFCYCVSPPEPDVLQHRPLCGGGRHAEDHIRERVWRWRVHLRGTQHRRRGHGIRYHQGHRYEPLKCAYASTYFTVSSWIDLRKCNVLTKRVSFCGENGSLSYIEAVHWWKWKMPHHWQPLEENITSVFMGLSKTVVFCFHALFPLSHGRNHKVYHKISMQLVVILWSFLFIRIQTWMGACI